MPGPLPRLLAVTQVDAFRDERMLRNFVGDAVDADCSHGILISCYAAHCRKHETRVTAIGTVFEQNEAAGETVILEALVPVVRQREAAAGESEILEA